MLGKVDRTRGRQRIDGVIEATNKNIEDLREIVKIGRLSESWIMGSDHEESPMTARLN